MANSKFSTAQAVNFILNDVEDHADSDSSEYGDLDSEEEELISTGYDRSIDGSTGTDSTETDVTVTESVTTPGPLPVQNFYRPRARKNYVRTKVSSSSSTVNHVRQTDTSNPSHKQRNAVHVEKENVVTPRKKRCLEEPAWKDSSEKDIQPSHPYFTSRRTPGVQLSTTNDYSAADLFQLFLPTSLVKCLCDNTFKQNNIQANKGKKYAKSWKYMHVKEFYAFLAIIIFMGLVHVPALQDYWEEDFFGQPYVKNIMSRDRFLTTLWNLHMSDPDKEDKEDPLTKLRPMYDDIQLACKTYYCPSQKVSVDERMVSSKAQIGMKQYIKNKPTKWGYKLFVLADSTNGYTSNFSVYTGKRHNPSANGLGYDTVMFLLDDYLNQGFHLYVDNFYTSPKLFSDLAAKRTLACGTVRENRVGFPRAKGNELPNNANRGDSRWIRDGKIVFVKWKDTRVVSMCSTIHVANGDDSVVQRRVRTENKWQKIDVPIPPAVKEYNHFMGGVDLSDQQIQYYNVLHKTKRWYKTLFLHMLDISLVNSYIIDKELRKGSGKKIISQKEFRRSVVEQLVMGFLPTMPRYEPKQVMHLPEIIKLITDGENTITGRLNCKLCYALMKKEQKTPWQCKACQAPLCLIPARNCFAKWHSKCLCEL